MLALFLAFLPLLSPAASSSLYSYNNTDCSGLPEVRAVSRVRNVSCSRLVLSRIHPHPACSTH